MLNTQQEIVFSDLINWYDSKIAAINLSAKAGFGKTFLLSLFVQNQLQKNIKCTIIAPTHAAIQQLILKIGPENNLLEYKTVAKALSLYPIQSNTSAKVIFGKFKLKPINNLVIVDESSMLGLSEVETLLKICNKIIFSGDSNQLAPVKKISGQSLLNTLPQLSLTEMVRSCPAIAEVGYKALDIPQYIPDTNEDNSIIKYGTEELLKEAFLKEVLCHKPGDCVFITYTNAEVQEVNKLAHKAISKSENLKIDDYIRLYSSTELGKNNSIVQIKKVQELNNCLLISTNKIEEIKVALPEQYNLILQEIEQITQLFKNKKGCKQLEKTLKELRAIAPIDFPYGITTHKSQGASIPIVYANSQQLHGKKSFYVAYTRAIEKLRVVNRITKAKGVRVIGEMWVNKKLNISLDCKDILNVAEVHKEITKHVESPPSISHLACVLNPSHASKSAKGWTLGY